MANWGKWQFGKCNPYNQARVRSIVAMNGTGRVTLPVEARRALGLKEDAFFEVHVEQGTIVLKPVVIVPYDQAGGQVRIGAPGEPQA